jgi:hypothetical protein
MHTTKAVPETPGVIFAKDFVMTKPGQTIEQAQKEYHLNRHEQNRQVALTALRRKLKSLYLRRLNAAHKKMRPDQSAYVTAADARRMLTRMAEVNAMYSFDNHNFLGALFRTADWAPTGETILSETKGSHANRLLCWQYVGVA